MEKPTPGCGVDKILGMGKNNVYRWIKKAEALVRTETLKGSRPQISNVRSGVMMTWPLPRRLEIRVREHALGFASS